MPLNEFHFLALPSFPFDTQYGWQWQAVPISSSEIYHQYIISTCCSRHIMKQKRLISWYSYSYFAFLLCRYLNASHLLRDRVIQHLFGAWRRGHQPVTMLHTVYANLHLEIWFACKVLQDVTLLLLMMEVPFILSLKPKIKSHSEYFVCEKNWHSRIVYIFFHFSNLERLYHQSSLSTRNSQNVLLFK